MKPVKPASPRLAAALSAMLAAATLLHADRAAHAQQPPQQRPQPAPVQGAPTPFSVPTIAPGLPTVPLQPLLDRVAREAKKAFLVDGRIAPDVYLGGVPQDDVTYPLLLSILRANGLAAVEIEGRVNVIPLQDARFSATPIVQNDDSRVAADEWVTRVLTTRTVDSSMLVPILRPMLPQGAHFAALPPNMLVVVDRYANVQRITAIVRSLDQPPTER
jgi:general secretion pathway protein D